MWSAGLQQVKFVQNLNLRGIELLKSRTGRLCTDEYMRVLYEEAAQNAKPKPWRQNDVLLPLSTPMLAWGRFIDLLHAYNFIAIPILVSFDIDASSHGGLRAGPNRSSGWKRARRFTRARRHETNRAEGRRQSILCPQVTPTYALGAVSIVNLLLLHPHSGHL